MVCNLFGTSPQNFHVGMENADILVGTGVFNGVRFYAHEILWHNLWDKCSLMRVAKS